MIKDKKGAYHEMASAMEPILIRSWLICSIVDLSTDQGASSFVENQIQYSKSWDQELPSTT